MAQIEKERASVLNAQKMVIRGAIVRTIQDAFSAIEKYLS